METHLIIGGEKLYKEKKDKDKEPKMAYKVFIAILASIPFTRPLLHLRRRKIIDQSVIEEPRKATADCPKPPTQVPVIYIHGFRGGDYTTEIMVQKAGELKKEPKFLKVSVDLFGNIELSGTYTNDSKPIIQLVFKEKIIGVFAICYMLRMILPFLAKKFNFSSYNAVGHSLGAPSIVRTEMKTQKRRGFPRLKKAALVAGPFDGVMFLGDLPNVNSLTRQGRPIMMNASYLSMLRNRRKFPKDISILNIYGNIGDETNTDRFISVVSAKSIRYILAPIVQHFSEMEVRGPAAEHSEMHDNPLVIGVINRFIDY